MKKWQRWSADELAFVRENADKMTRAEIAARLKRSGHSVRKRGQEIGVKFTFGLSYEYWLRNKRAFRLRALQARTAAILARRKAAEQRRAEEYYGIRPDSDATFARSMAGARYENDPRSTRPQPIVVYHRPATHIDQVGALG